MQKPLVSVIVSAYNHEMYVEQAILSVINQTYSNIELLVFDDGSNDSTPDILERLSKQHDFYFERQRNIGLPATRNKGILLSKGAFITGVASDDVMLPERIEKLMEEMLKLDDEYAMVCGDVEFIDDNDRPAYWKCDRIKYDRLMPYFLSFRKNLNFDNFGSYETLIRGNYIPAPSVLIKKAEILRCGLYDPNVLLEDWDMWLKLSRDDRKIKYIDSKKIICILISTKGIVKK